LKDIITKLGSEKIPSDASPFELSYVGGYIEFSVDGISNSDVELFDRDTFSEDSAIGKLLSSNAQKHRLVDWLNDHLWTDTWQQIYEEKHMQQDEQMQEL